MNRQSMPIESSARAPTFTAPRLVKTSQSRFSFSFGSGLCSQSSFSTSSGKSSKPADGRMLNFSDTVWVFRSSSLPVRDGALESSNGDMNGLSLESRLAIDSESQLDRCDDMAEEGRMGDSSRNGFSFDFFGGSSSSADSAIPEFWYMERGDVGDRIL